MDQLLSMGFPQELASRALAATGGKSTLKATEWLLNQRADADPRSSKPQLQSPPPPAQPRVDRFFPSSASTSRPPPPRFSPPSALRDNVCSSFLASPPDAKDLPDLPPPSKRPAAAPLPASCSRSPDEDDTDFGQSWKIADDGKVCGLPPPPECEKGGFLSVSPVAANDRGAEVGDAVPGRPFKSFLPPPPAAPEPPPKRPRVEEDDHQLKAPAATPLAPVPASRKTSKVPLAERMRPTTIDEVVGQDHLLGSGGILRSLLQNDTVPSVILWGPPGTGKTSLARAMSRTVSCRFVSVSAVTSGVKEVREILEEAKRQKKMGQRTIFFVDEVHRFNKAQQDAFLPSVEAGHVVFIGATTENPSFEVNGALLSRCKVLTLNKLQPESIKKLLERALSNTEKGIMATFVDDPLVKRVKVEEEALQFLAGAADGDARVALNALEVAFAPAVAREKHRIKQAQDGPLITAERKNEGADVRKETVVLSQKDRPRPAVNTSTLKRELPLKLSALKESLHPSQEEYKRPFKKFVGGREVTSQAKGKETVFDLKEDLPAAKQAAEGTRVLIEPPVVELDVRSTYVDSDPRDGGENAKQADVVEKVPEEGDIVVGLADVSEALQRSHLLYDKSGEEHYNIISALHKSMRGGDADAAIYWLARMLEGGEGPLYVARRLIRFASEDVGLADPLALSQAVACYQACHFLGMPECNVHLAQCVAYLSLAPKSVAVYQAVEAAQQIVKETAQNEPVPLHLRNAATGLMKQLGYGKGYIYPPSHEGLVEQDYLPPSLRGHKFLKWP